MSQNSAEPSRGPFVVIEEPTEPRATSDSSSGLPLIDAGDERVPQPLMIALVMIVIDEFRERLPKVPLADRNQPIETFLFNRPYEPFGVGIGIRRPQRRLHDVDPRVTEQLSHLPTPFPVAVAEEHAMIAEQSVVRRRTRPT